MPFTDGNQRLEEAQIAASLAPNNIGPKMALIEVTGDGG
jgi:hypothetical protein